MASWTDGAAYAPIERPDGFAEPEVEPLARTASSIAPTEGAVPPPQDFRHDTPAIPLELLSPEQPSHRNPTQPFVVSGGLMTTASSMGRHTARDPRTPFVGQRGPIHTPTPGTLPPPTGEPLALGPDAPPRPAGAAVDTLMSSPAARQPVRRGRSAQEMSTQRTLVFLAVACCVLGFTIGAAAPYMLIAAGGLSLRATFLTGNAGVWAIGVALALLVAGFIVAPELEVLLGRLASLSFGIWFITSAASRSREDS